eukprot:TRINITY_DN3440_c0_g1_i1.p1 TRINITY_DN3440_c0_g1~~TRINITY_DN3440_c0_g1_i1.p1  ORF type:complete len:404 (-),score=92.19 TRINITY_DN3440_c0_g1_i1:146-1357(-)
MTRGMHPYALLYYPFYLACFPVFTLWFIFIVLIPRLWYRFRLSLRLGKSAERKHVVIVGGGFAGSEAAKYLEHEFDVTMVDLKDFWEFTPSVLRTIVEPVHIRGIQVLHNKYLKHTNIIQAQVQSISRDQHVVLADRKIPFDYLIINSGSNYTQPFKEGGVIAAARANTLRESYYTIRKVNHVLIIGGGIVGVELAGEIISHFKNKKVTLVHSQAALIHRFPERAIKYCENYLKKRGVEIIYNERVVGHNGDVFITNQGRKITTGAAFLCTGIAPNSNLLKEEYEDTLVDQVPRVGYVRTNDFLQLQGREVYPNIFAAGDVVDVKEEKLAQVAEDHAYLVAENIKRMERGVNLLRYVSPEARPILISLGKFHGVFVLGDFAFTGPFPALLKEAVEWKTLVRYW